MLVYGQRLRAGDPVSDEEFDAVYPPAVRAASARHWTPVQVARRAAQLLTETGGAARVLDIGAGPGKFCIVGALCTSGSFTGVEQRLNLVEAALAATPRFGAQRARVVHANLLDFDCSGFDGFYFYNPFREQIELDDDPIDGNLERSQENFKSYIATTIATLIRAPVGTAVVTFHGFGGRMPPQYRRVITQMVNGGELALWIRSSYSAMLKSRQGADAHTR
jgi:hypothetical protein